ncbi:hypothetical protein ADEAN_000129200 [Angomonas deanei]|uniref:Uncharacterized protein n=1 Tax=Angomonas deanei TaxID=59799 RepID=A0A7G2C2H3_9TRYP|nr:hypothetical protein ADEAN_000129200 [Angomonas deanei]
MSQKPVEQPLSTHDRPAVTPATGNALPTYGDVSQGTVLQPIVLPDGRTAYVPVSTSAPNPNPLYSPYTSNQYTPSPDTAHPPVYRSDLSRVLNYYNSGRPSTCCLLSSRAVVLTLNSLAFVFSILSIGAPFVESYNVCQDWLSYSQYYGYYYHHACLFMPDAQHFALDSYDGAAYYGAIVMACCFALYIPTLVLSAIFLHIGRKYPERERQDAADQTLSVAVRRDRALERIHYDVNITKALFTTTLLSFCACVGVTAAYFVEFDAEFSSAVTVIGPPMAVVAMALYLAAFILTPIRCATGGSFRFPEEGSNADGDNGCCCVSREEYCEFLGCDSGLC